MQRLRLLDIRTSAAPSNVGLCAGDLDRVAQEVNEAQRRLIFCREAGIGWYGSWAEVVFTVEFSDPFITCPRDISRIESLAVCQRPIQIQNQFFQTMRFGIGPQKPGNPRCQFPQVYSQNNTVTFKDLNPIGKTIRVVITNAADISKRVLLQGLDSNGDEILSQDGLLDVQGIYLSLNSPFVQAPMGISKLTGIQKDPTVGPLKFYEVDLATGDTVLLLTMQPDETTADYRRYYLAGLPRNCCPDPNNPTTHILVTAIVKLEFIPATQDTSWLYIQNQEAILCEMQAIRYSRMDNGEAQQMALQKHTEAVRYLQGELVFRFGKDQPAVEFLPFGSARTQRVNLGMI